jgi:hypothetical protein
MILGRHSSHATAVQHPRSNYSLKNSSSLISLPKSRVLVHVDRPNRPLISLSCLLGTLHFLCANMSGVQTLIVEQSWISVHWLNLHWKILVLVLCEVSEFLVARTDSSNDPIMECWSDLFHLMICAWFSCMLPKQKMHWFERSWWWCLPPCAPSLMLLFACGVTSEKGHLKSELRNWQFEFEKVGAGDSGGIVVVDVVEVWLTRIGKSFPVGQNLSWICHSGFAQFHKFRVGFLRVQSFFPSCHVLSCDLTVIWDPHTTCCNLYLLAGPKLWDRSQRTPSVFRKDEPCFLSSDQWYFSNLFLRNVLLDYRKVSSPTK